jgi:hypothetical protein
MTDTLPRGQNISAQQRVKAQTREALYATPIEMLEQVFRRTVRQYEAHDEYGVSGSDAVALLDELRSGTPDTPARQEFIKQADSVYARFKVDRKGQ